MTPYDYWKLKGPEDRESETDEESERAYTEADRKFHSLYELGEYDGKIEREAPTGSPEKKGAGDVLGRAWGREIMGDNDVSTQPVH